MGGGVRDSGRPGPRGFGQAGCAKAMRDRIAGADAEASPRHGAHFRLADRQTPGVWQSDAHRVPVYSPRAGNSSRKLSTGRASVGTQRIDDHRQRSDLAPQRLLQRADRPAGAAL